MRIIVEKYFYSLNNSMDIKFIVRGYNFDDGVINVEFYPNGFEESAIVSGVPMIEVTETIPSEEEILQHIGRYYQQLSAELTSITEEEAQERDKKYEEMLIGYKKAYRGVIDTKQEITVKGKNKFDTSSKYGSQEQVEQIEHIVLDVLKKVGVIK